MTPNLVEQIQQLPSLSRAQLASLWNEHFSSPPPDTLRKQLMIPLLSYKLQERFHGGLSMHAKRRLETIAFKLPRTPRSNQEAMTAQQATRILRQWHGEMHEVWSTEEGFLYRGERYKSLSKIATVITGTKWSGPAFFGVKK